MIIKDIRKITRLLVISLSFSFFLPPYGYSQINTTILNNILKGSCTNLDNIGIKVFSISKGEARFNLNSNKLFIPASNIKLITTAAVLKELGIAYQFKTIIATNGKIEDGIVNGNLYIKGQGNPTLVSEDIWAIVNGLNIMGVKAIKGDIIGDESFFDDKRRVESWTNGNGHDSRAYNAPISALSLNFNTITVYVKPAKEIGALPIVYTDPPTSYIEVVNHAKTVVSPKGNRIIADRISNNSNNKDKVIIKGTIGKDIKVINFYRSISNPSIYLLTVFKEFLIKWGIRVEGNILVDKQSTNASVILEHKSKPLPLIIYYLNKLSNNLIAENLLKTLGGERLGQPGTTEKGLEMINRFMTSIGIDKGQYNITDGSGYSKLNRLSPAQIVSVLLNINRDFELKDEYMSSLPIVGIDGSTKKRLVHSIARHKVRAKTGSLNGVSSLSGYAVTSDNELLAFSILMNDNRCSYYDFVTIQNKIVLSMVDNGRYH